MAVSQEQSCCMSTVFNLNGDMKDASAFLNAVAVSHTGITAALSVSKGKKAHDARERLKRNARFKKTGKI